MNEALPVVSPPLALPPSRCLAGWADPLAGAGECPP